MLKSIRISQTLFFKVENSKVMNSKLRILLCPQFPLAPSAFYPIPLSFLLGDHGI